MDARIEAELAALEGLSSAALKERWVTMTSSPVPRISPAMLRLALGREIQARALGGFDRQTGQRLAQAMAAGSGTVAVSPGTRLVREWQGRAHVVTVGEDGAVRWEGRGVSLPLRRCPRHHRHALVRACLLRPQEEDGGMKSVRCAIYTRKSSEEGLAQDFNSLDAKREACSAYILSQASEGWSQVPDRYDDGGLSGGTLERPALRRLLEDVAQGRIDIVVVYKVDRLTRSLLDFSKLVEAFDAASASFVSITQSFNTTTSMGRLTLNMLLSFAQFEREVTAERIRDKIAASKAKGMWMGGIPPLGYRPDGRSLAVVEEHAALVRTIFGLYLETGNVRCLAQRLERDGLLAPMRTTGTGRRIGGRPLSRGQLYLMLKCRTYTGRVQHGDQVYPGLHDAIVPDELYDAVQAQLAANTHGHRQRIRAAAPSLLAGRIVDRTGVPFIASHASKGSATGAQKRWRYYASAPRQSGGQGSTVRIPAREIDAMVLHRIATLFEDMLDLIERTALEVDPRRLPALEIRGREIAAQLRGRNRELLDTVLLRVEVEEGRTMIHCSSEAIAALLQAEQADHAPARVTLVDGARLRRSGRAMKLVQQDGRTVMAQPDASLVRLIVQAHRWWDELRKGEVNITMLCEREKVSDAWMSRVLRLAFPSPAITGAILTGRQPAGLNSAALLATGAVPVRWCEQERMMMQTS
ncbi:recombinase family protein [Sphingobium amiense]|uniref:Recombinase family protein n=2 Tax=Sphingobium amiense TaxID=135719 RepID=A0A494WDM4_9SPHN|nr:recombinase family protein [Sphingobium amiense]